jgi:hypothetical protein
MVFVTMDAPRCRLCKEKHWPRQGCVTGKLQPKLRVVSKKPLEGGDATNVAEAVPGKPCPTCGRMVPKYKDNAARQRAYRERKRNDG